jgi:hypothetical protein
MVEDIIAALSRIYWLFVIARNSSFTYKNRIVDVKQVGRELGVRYVLEGSVRKSAKRVRITGQLIDATTGAHLWADRFEGTLQDHVTASVVGAIAPQLEQAEIARAKRKPTESLDAYDYYLRGVAHFHRGSREGIDEGLPTFSFAVSIIAASHALAGNTDESRQAMEHLRRLDPTLWLSTLREWIPLHRPQDVALFSDGLRKAGLPE